MLDFSDFIILLARQRSGTNAFRSILHFSHHIHTWGEVFNPDHYNTQRSSERDSSYFLFLKELIKRDCSRVQPRCDEMNFLDFLDYLRIQTVKKYSLIDIKYNSSHHISNGWYGITNEPFLFGILKKYCMPVINIQRQNYLRYYMSEKKAEKRKSWHLFDENLLVEQEFSIEINIPDLLSVMKSCRYEDDHIKKSFEGYPRYLSFDYDNLFSRDNNSISQDVLNGISELLQCDIVLDQKQSIFKKQSYLPLNSSIKNFNDVRNALLETDFEYCLTDERSYQ